MSEIDDLINIDPLSLSAQDLDKTIAFYRQSRANWEAGIKPEKEKRSGGIPLDKIVQSLAPPPAPSSFRRR
jgi:hypothetical protein